MRPYETDGQYLTSYLLNHQLVADRAPWSDLENALLASSRSRDWVEAFNLWLRELGV